MRYFLQISLLSSFLLWGCYTQFPPSGQILPDEGVKTLVDSTGDTIKVIQRTDTIISRERETCVWVRDVFGRPILRCYDSYYPRNWFFYNSPWWFRNDPFWYDYERCPRYYRYDPSCGCCRYMYKKNDSHFHNDYNRPKPPDNSSSSPNNSNSSPPSSGNSTLSGTHTSGKARTSGTKAPISNPQPVNQTGVSKATNTEVTDTLLHSETQQETAPDSTDSLAVKKRDIRSRRSR